MEGGVAAGRPFTRRDFEEGVRTLLRDGHSANAKVYLFSFGGRSWSVKDFSSRSWLVRRLVAPFLFWRETRAVNRIGARGVDGVPREAFRVDREAIAVEFIPGGSLSKAMAAEPEATMTLEFLKGMERLMEGVHRAGFVHLDARGTGNWVVRPDGTPGLIDFQAALCTDSMPAFARRVLEDIDNTGYLKKWEQYHPGTMGPERLEALERGNRYRSKWRLRGYFWRKKGSRRR